MLVHLSKTSPYVCDLSLGPIEQANRMALAPTKRMLPFLDIKESFPKQTRTPLKLLAPEEVPLEASPVSREPSLQPVWYTEQTIVDEQHQFEKEGVNHSRSILPTIESQSPALEPAENEELPSQPSLMRKSSTFTLEPQASLDFGSQMNDSEKENDSNIITSTQTDPTRHPTAPTDESFRALEHLLGLGSTNVNMTMTTTAQESPKSNHDTLSLTIVTPTELINNTTTASLHVSYAPAGGSLPSSQNVLLMPTIESITDPSINSTLPPPFSVDNSVSEETTSNAGTVLTPEKNNASAESFRFTDDETDEDDNNFSFELNDFPTESPSPVNVPPPPTSAPIVTIRAPTSADVAYRALIKPRIAAAATGRVSQPVKMTSPLAESNRVKVTVRSSVPNPPNRVLRSSSRRVSIKIPSEEKSIEFTKLIEIVTVPEEENDEEAKSGNVTLNLTTTKEMNCSSADDADRSGSTEDIVTPVQPELTAELSREFTFNTPTLRTTRASERRRSMMKTSTNIVTRSARSCLPSIPIQSEPIREEEKEKESSPSDEASLCSTNSSNRTLLSVLETNPTSMSEAPMIVLQKSLAGSASPSPNPTPILSAKPRESLLSPRRSINPLHSSTPSVRKSLQLVSIGEQEQVSTTVPSQLIIDTTTDEEQEEEPEEEEDEDEEVSMIDNEQQVNIVPSTTNEGIQTSPPRQPTRVDMAIQTSPIVSPRRVVQTVDQQTSPLESRTFSCQTSPIAIPIVDESPTPIVEPTHTPIHSKAMFHLRRNVRFQFTPSTDARLAAKERLEEETLKMKKEIPIHHEQPIEEIHSEETQQQQQQQQQVIVVISDQEREEDTEDEHRKQPKTKKKKSSASKKKKNSSSTMSTKTDESSEEAIDSPVLLPQVEVVVQEPILPLRKKRVARLPAPVEPEVESKVVPEPEPEPEPIVVPTKRPNRKRPNPKTSTSQPPSENTSPNEPVVKKVKTNKITRESSPETHSTRSRSKTNQPVEPPAVVSTTKKTKKTSPTENSTTKRKTTISSGKKGKRRLHSVEQDEGLNTADEEEVVCVPPPVEVEAPIQQEELTMPQEDREKIEGLTVAELKTRLTSHGENLPKGARKAELVALLMKIELRLFKERKEAEAAAAEVQPVSRKTRRKK